MAYRWRWPALLVVLAAEVMDLLDVLVTVIAGPSVLRDLGGSTTFIQWFTAAYTVAMASGLLIGGRLGDMFGRRRVFLIGMAGFAVASLLCTVALSAEMLVATRVVQGFFGAAMIPQGLGLIKEMFPPDEMARAYGLFGPVMGLSSVGGPVLAGWLVDADLLGLGWRMIFAINLPIALVGIVAGLRYLPASSPDPDLSIDLPGSLLATIGMAGLIIPLIQGREHDWPAWSFALIALALAAFVGFAVLERRRDRAGRATLVVPSLFGKRAFTAGLVTGLLFFASLMGISLVVTLFLQLGLGFDPLRAGVAGLPQALGMVVGFLLTQALHVLGRRLMHLGATTVVGGALLLSATIGSAGDAIDAWSLAPGLAIIGVGLGLTMAPFFDIVLAGVSPSESGSASGTLTSVQQIGGALGIAVLGTVFFTPVEDAMPGPTVDTFASATQACLWFAAVFVVGAGLLTFLLPRRAEHFGAH
ncbi:MFS transporter [Intrasporangium sp.]|uniref:MFS transporter n=1 Tax=Intrasporangium sp. TaxID=1925024 RepID=UPI00293A4407|nr:MFS transporter [Intrasporangium sp.]MDV3220497.1 MFS transporter [Intrasporangium sp.]